MKLKKFIKFFSLASSFILAFWSGSFCAVKIIASSPQGQVEGRDAAYTITVTFNQPMVALEKLPEGAGSGPLEINPAVKGKFRWQGTSTLSFTPDHSLPFATEFEVAVPKGIKSEISGEVLEKDHRWKFETLRPQLLLSFPSENEDWVELDQKFFLLFNQPMDIEKAKPFIKIKEIKTFGEKKDLSFAARYLVAKDIGTIGSCYRSYSYLIDRATSSYVIVLTPQAEIENGSKETSVGWLKKDGSYIVELEQGLPGKEGNLGLSMKRTISFKTYQTFRFIRPNRWDGLEPTSELNFIFSNQVKYPDFLKNLTIEPKVEFSEYYYNYDFSYPDYDCRHCPMYFAVELKPSATYYVRIKGSLTDKYGQTLGKDIETHFTTTDYAPRMTMPSGLGIVESYLEPQRYPVTFLNVDKVKLRMARIVPNDIVKLIANDRPPEEYQVDRLWQPKIIKNKPTTLPIQLKEILGNSRYGLVFIQVEAMKAFLQVTSMGISGKFSPDGNLIYVSDLKNAKPVKNCFVELRNDKNEILWNGKTDKNGFAKTPGWEELKIIPKGKWETPRIWVIAKNGPDAAFIQSGWGTGIYPYSFNIPYEEYPEYPKYGGHIFTERGIYRPGENVYIKGIVRERRMGRWELPRISDYQLIIKDSRNSEVVKTTTTLSDFGSFEYTYNINKNAPTGYYTIHLWQKEANEEQKVGDEYEGEGDYNDRKIRLSSDFRVEEYKPASFEVNVGYNQDDYILQDTATVKINGWYLFGAPMPEAELNYTVRLDQTSFEPEGYSGYSFSGYKWENEEDYFSPGIIFSGATKLDKEGRFNFTAPIISQGAIAPFNLITEGVVTSPDRQRITGRKTTLVHNEYYIGLKPNSTFIEKGKNIRWEIITVSPEGNKVENKDLACKLIRQEWNSVKRAGVGGRLEWHTERADVVVSSFTAKSTLSPYRWEYTPDKSGYYIFTVESKDSRHNLILSSQYFYVTGKDYCAWEREDDDRIELVCDRAKYKPGDVAKILVKSPYEKANAVVTLEREGIIEQWVTKVTGSADTISVPITKEYLPNVFVCVMLYQGRIGEAKFSEEKDRDLGKPSFKIGYTNLPIDPGDKHLSIAVESDKKEYKPGEEVKIKLKVTDAKRKGTKAEVTVAVADLGILNLINYQTPDSFPYFYGPKPLSVETAETRLHIIGQRNYGEKGENRGGGGGLLDAGMYFRTKFLPTVYWNPKLLTSDNGTAQLSFTLPDNLTTFRIMATAQTKDSLFGGGENRFAVNRPLLLKPSLPRFALLGDRFVAGVLCHNNTAKDGTVLIEVAVKGIKLIGENTQQVTILKGEAKEVNFEFLADQIGKSEFYFKAVLDKETDGLKWTIPVSIPRPTEAVATYGSTTDKSKEGIKIPSNIYTEASSLNFAIAPTALIGLKGGLEYLFEYPYGCLEQKTSKIFPLILAADFIELFNLAPLKEHNARELITDYLKELSQFQTDSGGFTFWKGASLPSPYLTAYVLWAVAQAKSNGYAVDEDGRIKAGEYLRNYLRSDKSGWEWPYHINAELCTKAFCVYALSLNGFHEQSYINNLYQKLDQMPLFGKIYLLKAINNEKMGPAMIEAIVEALYNKAKFSPTEVHFEESDDRGMEWIWHSNVRTTAAVLQGLIEVKGEYPNAEKVARWLARERKSGRWLTTQENIYVFYAFQEYVKAYEKDNPDFTAKILLEGKEVMKEIFKGRTLEAQSLKLPVDQFKPEVLLPVIFEKTGKGRLYYDFRMIYAPKGELESRSEGMDIEKKIEVFKSGKIEGNNYAMSGRYKVTIKVKTDQERHFVVVDDPLPAGFEVVNLSFATESGEESREFDRSATDTSYRWWGTFDHWENYDDRVLIFANYLERGEHTYSYLVQATTSGDFLMPAAKAEEMYTPEVFARSEQKRIKIK